MKQNIRLLAVVLLFISFSIGYTSGNVFAVDNKELFDGLSQQLEVSSPYNQLENDYDSRNVESYNNNYQATMLNDNGRHIGAVMTLLITAIAVVFAYSIYRRKKQME